LGGGTEERGNKDLILITNIYSAVFYFAAGFYHEKINTGNAEEQ
jgi:hypothetical protein